MKHYEVFHDILVNLFQEIMDIEGKALITPEFKDISVNDMHIIEAIGEESPRNMSSVARTLSVTVGTLTIAVNGLVKKGLCTPGKKRRRQTSGADFAYG